MHRVVIVVVTVVWWAGCATPRRFGSLEKSVIRDVVRAHRDEVSTCYENEVLVAPTVKGQLKLKFTISPSGDVSEAAVTSSSVGSAALERCVVAKVRSWVFPAPKGDGEVTVTWPLSFGQAIEVIE